MKKFIIAALLGGCVLTGSVLAGLGISQVLVPGAITTSYLADGSVTTAKIAAAAVNRSKLDTATGSCIGAGGLGCVTGQDYVFFPSATNDTDTAAQFLVYGAIADPANQNAIFAITSTVGTTTIRYRYVSASDNPAILVVYDADGNIKAVHTVDDDSEGLDVTTTSCVGCAKKKYTAKDLGNLNISEQAYSDAIDFITAKEFDTEHLAYRALQKYAQDDAPAKWIYDHTKVDSSTKSLTLK